ncbi:GroES-like protein [Hypoxylon rubiginosum]|uniref:GroES-like protein n=1 Tax=Hypoxylon rubiginosum TaxID=110542 RepID=A0ACB9YTN0_9PEZI|nr:GroES-like protein [Hypoxylon rubiginosum]
MATPSPPPPAPLPERMKAVQVTAFNHPYEITTVPVPIVGPHDLLVKVAVASYCHTDGMVASGAFHTSLPVTASHEGAGTVVAAGTSVSPEAFRPGDRVMCGLPLHPCAACPDCVGSDGNYQQYCVNVAGHVGVHVDGCLAEFVRVDARFSTKLPPNIGFRAAAPLACAGRSAWRGVVQTGLTTGEWLLVVGAGGGLGHLAVQFARPRGLRVVAVDARDGALELARECGADVVVDARQGGDEDKEKCKEWVVAEVRRVTGGEGAHAALVLSDAEGATATAAAATRMHGTLVQVAQPEEVRLPFRELVFRDIRVRGSLLCSPGESRDMVRFIAERGGAGKGEGKGEGEGGIRVETVVFEGLESIGELVRFVRSGRLRGKAVVVVDPEQLEEEKKLGAE